MPCLFRALRFWARRALRVAASRGAGIDRRMSVPTTPAPAAPVEARSVTPARAAKVRAALDNRVGTVVAVVESVRRRHNASALVRSCEAFGIHEVHLITGFFKPSTGASRAAERWVKVRVFPNVSDSIDELHARGFKVYVADLVDGAYTPETLPVDTPVAVLFGSEVRGVSAEASAKADGAVMIPMRGLTESLNVSVSGAILLRAAADRRRAMVGNDLDAAEKSRFFEEWIGREESGRRGLVARAG